MRKLLIFTLIITIISIIANVGLFIVWQKSENYYNALEKQLIKRDELIKKFYDDQLVMDKSNVELLNSIGLNDSVNLITNIPTKINDSERRIIYKTIKNYKDKIEKRDIVGYTNLFADTVTKFFLTDSVSKNYIHDNTARVWESHPNSEYAVYNFGLLSIDRKSNEFVVYIPYEIDGGEYITEFRLNNDFKITYIRDYLGYIDNK